MRAYLLGLIILSTPSFAVSVEAKSGWYAVVCGTSYPGKNKGEAMKACKAGEKALHLSSSMCGCERNADLIEMKSNQVPAYYSSACFGGMGKTRDAAIHDCDNKQKKWLSSNPGSKVQCACDREVQPLYGPYSRRKSRRTFDDAAVFRYLGADGEWHDEQGEAPCLVAGTPVLTPQGERSIEQIRSGDRVLSWSPQRHTLVPARVTRVKTRRVSGVFALRLSEGLILRATGNHPLYVPSRKAWVPLDRIKAGEDVGVVERGRLRPMTVASISWEEAKTQVFDLTIESEKSYLAQGIWVHNY